MPYQLTYQQLLQDLQQAYIDARRNKRQKPCQKQFEEQKNEKLRKLCDELWNRNYKPGISSCFIINDPKVREVFAAQFRDRIVHHLYFNYTHELLERTFISDSYSCIKHRGTHFGIKRLENHIRKESQNYTESCYVLKMDIKGYFMHINRSCLLDITLRQLRKMASHRIQKIKCERWRDKVDFDFVEYLTKVIVMQNPVEGCYRCGSVKEWERLPREKSLFCSDDGYGLPIGNLTSQLFSNVYLNELDQYAKRVLHCKHYGRYVDDFFVVSADRDFLCAVRKSLSSFLKQHLLLEINEKKTVVCDVRKGVPFLGAYLKPNRRYVFNGTLRRIRKRVESFDNNCQPCHLRSVINSYLGLLSHYSSYRIRRNVFGEISHAYKYGYFTKGMKKYVLR